MQRLLQFLYRYRAFLLFLFLEVLSFWLVIENNSYQGSKYFNSANAVVASINESSQGVRDFIDLSNQNRILAEENSRLKSLLEQLPDSLGIMENDTSGIDSSYWHFIPARVVNKSLFFQNNYLTIDKGSKDGIVTGMGIIGSQGVVGQVVSASDNFASVASLLHSTYLISSIHTNSGSLCTTSWDGQNPLFAQIQYLPRHLTLQVGDSIRSSGYNSTFPAGTNIGVIEEVSIADDATFYDVKVRLSTDFYKLSHVYIAEYIVRQEKDSLEQIND